MAKTRTGAPEATTDLAAAAARLRPIREELTALIDEDSRAYLAVIAAYRLPKATDAEKTARQAAVQTATRAATDVPLQTMRACERALHDASVVVRLGNPNAAADAAVGVHLLLAAVQGAALNVDVNLPGITDAEYRDRTGEERHRLVASADGLARRTIAGP